jgi:hypothetical protein
MGQLMAEGATRVRLRLLKHKVGAMNGRWAVQTSCFFPTFVWKMTALRVALLLVLMVILFLLALVAARLAAVAVAKPVLSVGLLLCLSYA